MRKSMKIICVILAVLVIVLGFVVYDQASQLSQVKQETAERDRYLAVLVNNHDCPKDFIGEIANINGFDGYDGLVSYLVSKGELYHIPAFTYKGEDYEHEYRETYAIKGVVVYCHAVEMGVIPAD